jgi:hypothetical protein
MPDLPTILYFLAIVGGTIILGFVIAYGLARTRHRSVAERNATEAGTHRLYEKEERET